MSTTATRRMLRVKEIAELWHADVESVLRVIATGELRAIDIACTRGRPTWRIDVRDLEDFELRRANTKVPKAARRKRAQAAAVDYIG